MMYGCQLASVAVEWKPQQNGTLFPCTSVYPTQRMLQNLFVTWMSEIIKERGLGLLSEAIDAISQERIIPVLNIYFLEKKMPQW